MAEEKKEIDDQIWQEQQQEMDKQEQRMNKQAEKDGEKDKERKEKRGKMLDMRELTRGKKQGELLGELKEREIEKLNQLVRSVKRGEVEVKGWDEERGLVMEVPVEVEDEGGEVKIKRREWIFSGKERDYLVGELRDKGIDVRKLKEVEIES